MKLVSVLLLSIFIASGCQKDSGSSSSTAEMGGHDNPTAPDAAAELTPLEKGKWGAENIGLEVNASGASYDMECGHGKIKQTIKPDSNGAFQVSGTITHYQYGLDSTHRTFDADYTGFVTGDKMDLTVVWEDEEGTTQRLNFILSKGAEGPASRCE